MQEADAGSVLHDRRRHARPTADGGSGTAYRAPVELHEGELAADEATVAALLTEQAPGLAGLPVRELTAIGTVNRVFRLGDDLAVRLPRLRDGGADLEREAFVVPRFAAALPVAVPEPRLLGEPSTVFPASWAVVTWVDGTVPEPGAIPVEDLIATILALRTVGTAALPDAGRATAAEADDAVRSAVAALKGFDRRAVLAAWEAALAVPDWDGERVPIHADLLPPNLLVAGGRLHGVLDWGTAGAGDPANDLVPAWSCLRGADRAVFRARLAPGAATWERARGIALAQAVVGIPYYAATNPGFTALCRATLTEVLADR